jgi:hypothetical protein
LLATAADPNIGLYAPKRENYSMLATARVRAERGERKLTPCRDRGLHPTPIMEASTSPAPIHGRN